MSDDFETLVRQWLRARAATDRAAVEAVLAGVAALPPRRGPRRILPLVASIAVIVGAVVVLPRLGGLGAEATPVPPALSPTVGPSRGSVLPGGPEAFAGDPRLSLCTFGLLSEMEFAFEMTRGRDYLDYLPAMGRAPELEDVVEPTFVLVYREGFDPVTTGLPGHDRTSPQPGHRTVCMAVDDGPMVYGDVDIAGLTVGDAFATASPASEPTPLITPEPPWMRGAVAALGCDDRPTGLGATSTWSRGRLGTTDQRTPDAALADLLDKTSTLYVAFPSAGFRRTDGGEAVAVYTYAWRGSTRAVVIVRSASAGGDGPWYVDDLAACDPSELDPAIEPGVDFSAWRNATGALADPATFREREDCYGGTQLTFEGRLYVWHPDHGLNSAYDPVRLDAPFGDDVELPADAVDTGYTGSGRALFLAADGTAAFMVRSDGVQRWPHVIGDDYQRTDCN